jgi:aldehyde:ferredoxin oxidoreductase
VDFYQGSVLRVDLTNETATVEPLNMEWAELYLGGKGLLFRHMWEYVPPGVDPWSPDNPVFLVTGPLAGTNVSTASRLVVGAKSPTTGILDDSYVGGSFAPELKFAGYDIVIISGAASSPTVVWIEDGTVRFVPADDYWGLKTSEIEAALRRDLHPQAKVLLVSALEQRGVLKDAFKAGAADFVSKPFDKENLQATLAQLLPETST